MKSKLYLLDVLKLFYLLIYGSFTLVISAELILGKVALLSLLKQEQSLKKPMSMYLVMLVLTKMLVPFGQIISTF
ncbi:hypothetical protein BD408DRAFT_240057 [Parasitella parasitica]|nr:hypothetical protein BD408DRAFT_240057 [Parasitella parasitica]